jgi:CO dehydrogenase maturation factor
LEHAGVSLLVLGAIESGGSGCACPESVLIKALVSDLVLHKDEAMVMDMEAGVEHLGRGTARGVDTMLVVVEPSRMSVDCAERVFRMAGEIGLGDVRVVVNKVNSPEDESWVRKAVRGHELAAVLGLSSAIRKADRVGTAALDAFDAVGRAQLETLLLSLQKGA